ncbi:hypothetical protein HORIV_26640 [Vreelandella olivaria]|uniref:Glycosyltransferase family 28 N-terminal domain-containing protein n=1 Tax=Vreelandella olivaria TaxID=390919 RepID=A0ABN5WTJ1_9GAMM|nr:hypothetical protein HORIV_26640 [Halomonas olivaria]
MTTNVSRRVLIMAGGTGGHVFPALSLANALQAQQVDVEWLGSPRGIENRLVPEAGIKLHTIAVSGLRGNGLTGWLKAPLNLSRAVLQARAVIRDFKPQVVVGLGGFASGPGGLAAWLTRVPLVIHEQNAVAGLTNRVLSRLAKRTYAAFPEAFGARADVIGNPVRDDIAALGSSPRDEETLTSAPCVCWWWGDPSGLWPLTNVWPLRWRHCPLSSVPRFATRREKGVSRRLQTITSSTA